MEILLKSVGEGDTGGKELLKGLARVLVLSNFELYDYKAVFALDKNIKYEFKFDDPQTQEVFDNYVAEFVTRFAGNNQNLNL